VWNAVKRFLPPGGRGRRDRVTCEGGLKTKGGNTGGLERRKNTFVWSAITTRSPRGRGQGTLGERKAFIMGGPGTGGKGGRGGGDAVDFASW